MVGAALLIYSILSLKCSHIMWATCDMSQTLNCTQSKFVIFQMMTCMMNEKRVLQINEDYTLSVSSVINRDTKQFGKKFLTDGNEETCWNSDEGDHQWILCQFKTSVQLNELSIQFQGGFASKKIVLQFYDCPQNLISETTIYPKDNNLVQNFVEIANTNFAKIFSNNWIFSMMEDSRQETILLLSKVLAKFQWLLNSYNLDYFVEEHWNLLPRTWQICLQNFDKNDIPLLLCPSKNNTTKHVFPLSLLCLREISILVRSSRTMAIDSNLSTQLAANEVNSDLTLSFSNEHKLPVKPLKTSDHILCRKIKLKKRHEIERLCKVIPPLLKMVDNCTDIIDCGSGQGHLDRVLTLCYGYRVFSIEADDDNVNSANDIDSTILNALRKSRLTKMADNDMPTKLNCFLTNEDKIGQLVGSQVLQDKHLLLGLHACGPLSNIILEQFVNSPDASCLVLACCCYMKTGNERFPMSNFLQKNIDFVLTREAKEVACHAIEKFLNKFYTKELDSLKVHGFRSCLELLINKYDPSKTHKGMRSVKIDSKMTFKEYLLKATRGLDVSIPCDVLESEFMVSYLSRLDQVVIFYALRLLVAPLVELFILMDYQEYLSEHSAVKRTYLVPLFEPSISPRNLILIAHK